MLGAHLASGDTGQAKPLEGTQREGLAGAQQAELTGTQERAGGRHKQSHGF